jgi:hypothetical protein
MPSDGSAIRLLKKQDLPGQDGVLQEIPVNRNIFHQPGFICRIRPCTILPIPPASTYVLSQGRDHVDR